MNDTLVNPNKYDMVVNVRGSIGSRGSFASAAPANAQGNAIVPANGNLFVTAFYSTYSAISGSGPTLVQDQGPATFTINFIVVSACQQFGPVPCSWDTTIPGNEAFSGLAVNGATDAFNVTPIKY